MWCHMSCIQHGRRCLTGTPWDGYIFRCTLAHWSWQHLNHGWCVDKGVFRGYRISAEKSFHSWHSPSGESSHASFILERVWILFVFYKSKLDIFNNRRNNNHLLPATSVDLKNTLKSLASKSLALHFTTSNSLNKSIPKYKPRNAPWPLLKEYIGLSSKQGGGRRRKHW